MSVETATTETTETATTETIETTETSMLNADETTETTTETQEEKPIEYEAFTVGEGLALDENLANAFKPIFAALKLDQAGAQKLVDLYSTEVVKKQMDTWNTMLSGWDEQAKTDAEIGGSKYDESLKTAARAFKSFEVPEAAEVMAQYGLHRHPAMIRLFARIGAKMSESTEVVTGGEIGRKTDAQILAEMYPSTQKK